MAGTVRFSSLASEYGPVSLAVTVTDGQWCLAVAEGRFATVYHSDGDPQWPADVVVGHHGLVNVLCKVVFARRLPDGGLQGNCRMAGLRDGTVRVTGMVSDRELRRFLNGGTSFSSVARIGGAYVYS